MSMLTHHTQPNALRPSPAAPGLVCASGQTGFAMLILNLHAGAPPGAEEG